MIFLHYQFNFGKEGKTKQAFALAIIYTMISFCFADNKLLFIALMYVIIAMWIITFVSIFKK